MQQLAAEERDLFCFRRGGGAAVGFQKAEAEGRNHAWVLWDVPPRRGPDSIRGVLVKIWMKDYRCTL